MAPFTAYFQFRLFAFILLTLVSATAMAQRTAKELRHALESAGQDTARMRILLDLANAYYDTEWNYANKVKVDSALTYLRQADRLSDMLGSTTYKNQALVGLGKYYYRCDNMLMGGAYFSEAIAQAKNLGTKKMEAQNWFDFGERTPPLDSLIQKKVYRYGQALLLFRQLNDVSNQVYMSQCIARTYLDHSNLDTAEKQLKKLLTWQTAIKDKTLAFTYDMMAIVEGAKGNYNNAIFLDLEAIRNIRLQYDRFLECRINARTGRWYAELGKVSSSLQYNFRAMEMLKSANNPNVHEKFFSYLLLRQIIQGLITQNRGREALIYLRKTNARLFPNSDFASQYTAACEGDCYTALKNYGLAETSYLKAIRQATLNGRAEDVPNEFLLLAGMSVKWQRFEKAHSYVIKFEETFNHGKDVLKIKEMHRILFKIDSASGNYLSAIQHFEKNKALNDSIFNEKKSRQIEELLVKYETSKKEQNILQLTNNTRLQQKELEKAALTRKLIMGTLVLLLLVSGFLFYAYSIKKRNNLALQQQQHQINIKNGSLQSLVDEKEKLLTDKGALLNEKEWLLKEIHHRVKNNLQVIIGLLYTQSRHLKDPMAVKAIQESQQRIYSIGLIHQKLYQSEKLDRIPMNDYIAELVQYICASNNIERRDIRIFQKVSMVNMDVAHAMPLGLIINEALTNAFKYAFPHHKKGVVNLALSSCDGRCELIISDDGIGLPDKFDPYKSKSMGITLIQGMTEQLEGKYEIDGRNGVTITITFNMANTQGPNSVGA
ncbi:MAG: sensor histidine kinase [Bacteroidota bacterium]